VNEEKLPQIRLKGALQSSHPWILWKHVEKASERIHSGSVVDIVDPKGQWVGRGFYNGHARIRLRLLTAKPEIIDKSFFAKRIEKAIMWRRKTLQLDKVTNAYRVVASEGDELTGLVIDRFDSCLVLEFFAAGMYRFRPVIEEILESHFPGAQFYSFAERHVQKQESFNCQRSNEPAPVIIKENGVAFRVAPCQKYKTGFFIDQRENRLAFSELCQGKRVLDLCCNSGGFSLYASLRGKAQAVTGVDLDEEVLTMAKENATLNGVALHFVCANLFDWLKAHSEKYDVVVLDPSKQTRSTEKIDEALKNYLSMNELAMRAVTPGGILLTCSCSGLIREEQFLDVIAQAAHNVHRTCQVFRITGAAADHPYLVDVPQGRYLKAVWGVLS